MDRQLLTEAMNMVHKINEIARNAYQHVPAERWSRLARLPYVVQRIHDEARAAVNQDNREKMAFAVMAAEALCHLLPAISDEPILIGKIRNDLNYLAGRLVGVFDEPGTSET